MNESLAARQEALQRQNQEVNQQVEAIEQLRQQLTNDSRPSSSSTSQRRTRSALGQVESTVHSTSSTRNDDKQNNLKSGLEINLRASSDSLSSQELGKTCRQFAKSEKEEVTTRSRQNSARRSERKKHDIQNEASPEDPPRDSKKSDSGDNSPNDDDPKRDSDPKGLSLEATVRYQKARLRILQDEADAAIARSQQLEAAQTALKGEMKSLKTENLALLKKNQQTQQLSEKQRELIVAQEAKEQILEGQLASAKARVEETLRAEKLASQQFRSKDVRLNRALEEIEKMKAQLLDKEKNHNEHMVSKAEYDQVVHDNKRLDKQKGELLIAFKKQMKLIDLLKRQRVHLEASFSNLNLETRSILTFKALTGGQNAIIYRSRI